MRPDDAPSGFWRRADHGAVRVDGVRLASDVPTRFFQTVDAYPSEWGRLRWRIQLNQIVADAAAAPMFRTFYPGVEWNLNRHRSDWFLTAWFAWDGPGPRFPELRTPAPARIDGDTALFHVASDLEKPLFLRSRVDARGRREVYEALLSRDEDRPPADPRLIVLDDIFDRTE
jgi:hypothetical protein